MKLRSLSRLLIVFLVLIAPYQSTYTDSSGWETVGNGIEYREFHLPDPNWVFVARMDRSNPNVILESSIAQGMLAQDRETVSGMAARYDQAINAWGGPWNTRNQVVVAINGSFFDVEKGVVTDGMIHSGWYVKQFADLGGGSGFVWKNDRSAFIGECIHHRPEKQFLTNLSRGNTLLIDGINLRHNKNHQPIIYTPQYNRDRQEDQMAIEVLIELVRPLGILPPPSMTLGIVREIRESRGLIKLPFDHIVVATDRYNRKDLFNAVRVDDVVGISLEITHLEDDCRTPSPFNWTKAYASIGGSFIFLKDGVIKNFDDPGAITRHLRTAICYNEDFIFFLVVDGRADGYSVGMTIEKLAYFCKDTLGATWGINQDGGGSSTMWVNGEVKNSPSDGGEREVANGFMMVVLEPMEQSDKFSSGDQVKTLYDANLRLGPGTNYTAFTSVAGESEGVILPHINHQNGAFAKGVYWWKVDFSGTVGWIDESALTPADKLHSIFPFHGWSIYPETETASDLGYMFYP